MITAHTPATLRAFEDEIAALFNAGRIPFPVHLSGGNEEQLIRVFEDVAPEDYVACSWRSHFHCLLRGVPEAELRQAILDGRSIALCFAKYRIVSSAIVGGILPIAVGIAMGLKRTGRAGRVWCFVGDMTERSGAYHECFRYASRNDLPMKFVVEDNGMSVLTPTDEAWGKGPSADLDAQVRAWTTSSTYRYTNAWPHQGTGKFVEF